MNQIILAFFIFSLSVAVGESWRKLLDKRGEIISRPPEPMNHRKNPHPMPNEMKISFLV
jgi:hypothetical protein